MKILVAHLTLMTLVILTIAACSLPSGAPGGGGAETAVPTVTEPSATAAVTPTVVETPPILDGCLLGSWKMDAYALNNKFLDLTQSATMYVTAPSEMQMNFSDTNAYIISGQTTMRFDIPNTSDYFELFGYHDGQGGYAADGRQLTIVPIDYNVDYGAMRAIINGQSAESPLTSVPIPETLMSPPTYASYRCNGNTLEITYDGPLGPVTEEWIR